MPSEFNHIDDFFRKKEGEASADNSMQDKHWQQMKGLLANPAPVAKIRTLNPKMLWQLLTGFAFIAVIGLLVWRYVRSNDNQLQADNSSKHVVVVTTENNNNSITTNQDTIDANSDTLKTINPPVWNGDLKINFPIGDQRSYLNQPSNEIRTENTIPGSIAANDKRISPEVQFASFFDQLRKPAQEFLINTNRDTLITCNEGTSIFIPANSFTDNNGIVNGEVNFSVREYYEMTDIIGNKLSTNSDDRQLVTGGMLNLVAIINGNPVSLKQNISLKIKMPTEKLDPAMQLFYGNCLGSNPSYLNEVPRQGFDLMMDTISCTPNGTNWSPAGQQQGYLDTKMIISVIDLLNDPRSVNTVKGKKIAKFILSDNSPLSEETTKKELQKRYGNLYNEIKVRRGWKPVEQTRGNAGKVSQAVPKSTNMTGISMPYVLLDSTTTILTNWNSFKNGLVGDSIRMTLGDAISAGLITNEEAEKYRIQFKNTTGSDNVDDYLELNRNYRFNVSSLGWINCDKFLAYSKEELTNFVVDAGTDYNQTYFQTFIVFDKFKSVLGGNWRNGKIVFNNIPLNEKISVVCVGIKDGKAVYSISETTVSKETLRGLQFQETNPADFREKMKMFGNVQKG